VFARNYLNLEWLEIAGQARNDGIGMARNDGIDMARNDAARASA